MSSGCRKSASRAADAVFYLELFWTLEKQKVRYLVVGGVAVTAGDGLAAKTKNSL